MRFGADWALLRLTPLESAIRRVGRGECQEQGGWVCEEAGHSAPPLMEDGRDLRPLPSASRGWIEVIVGCQSGVMYAKRVVKGDAESKMDQG
jgi:hypothetical protein